MSAPTTLELKLTPEQIAGMNVTQLKAESKNLYMKAAEIEKRHPDGFTPSDAVDQNEVKALLATLDVIEDALAPKLQAEAQRARIMKNVAEYSRAAEPMRHAGPDSGEQDRFFKSPGDQFVESAQFKALVDSGVLRSNSSKVELAVALKGGSLFEHKALVYSGSAVGGGFVQNDVQPGLKLPILQRELTVLDLIARGQTNSDTIEYVKEDTFTNAAAMTAEATATTGTSGVKPESTLAYSVQTSPVRTLAHWVPVTNRMLADAPALRTVINQRLLLGLDLTLESQIITGDGTGENFTGILNATGINVQGLGTDNTLDAIFKGRTLVRTTGKSRPTGVVLHPNDFQAIRLARENVATATLGAYLMGPPSQIGPTTVWGLPVVESEGITENTGLVGDFAMGCTLFDREEAQLRVGYIDDQFVRNMQTLLAELRAAFVVWRGASFTKVTGI